MTEPTERPGGLDANARGIAVLVAAVLIGLLLLWKAGDGGTTTTQVATDPVTSTTVDTSGLTEDPPPESTSEPAVTPPTDTSEPAKTPGDVSVVVLNGGGVVGAAGSVSDIIGSAGYQMGDAKNAVDSPNVDTTIVYFAEGFQAEAGAVASVLKKDTGVVQPLPVDALPGPGSDTADVTVVLGKDVQTADGAPATEEPG